MDPLRSLHISLVNDAESQGTVGPTDQRKSTASVLLNLGTSLESRALTRTTPAPEQDWGALIERVRAAAQYVRRVETEARDQEQRVEELLERVREDMQAASDRVRAAETRAAHVEARAAERIRAAEERAESAEARARIAEDWLQSVHEAIVSEFSAVAPSGSDA